MKHFRLAVPTKLDGQRAAQELFAKLLDKQDPKLEHLCIAHVDKNARCLHLSISRGSETGIDVPFKAIISDLLRHDSAGLILAHNHPSGDPRPSDSDCRATRLLATVVEVLDCRVVDHLIFGGGNCLSFRSLGLL